MSESYTDITGAIAEPPVNDRIDGLIDRLMAAANRKFSAATMAALYAMLGKHSDETAESIVADVVRCERLPANMPGAVEQAARAATAADEANRELPREDWVDAYEGISECDRCRAPVHVVRGNIARVYTGERELDYLRRKHRLRYTCGECGHTAGRVVPAKPLPPGHPRKWDIGEDGDFEAYSALLAEVNTWHGAGLVETRKSLSGRVLMETPMAIDVWIAAGCPPSWSVILDTIHKDGYLQADYEGRLAEYCDGWRAKLEKEREKRVGKASMAAEV